MLESVPAPLLYIVFALYGLATGSLAGALSYRLPRRQPVIFDRSRCTSCGATLGARDLIPVLSWLLAKGRCRHCKAPVSSRYLWIELAVTALFLAALALAPNLWAAVCLAFLGAGLVVLIVADLEARILPDPIQAGLALLALGWQASTQAEWQDMILGGGLGLGVGLLLRLSYLALKKRHGLGMGDVKFLGVAGLWLGLAALPSFLLLAGLLGVAFGLVWRLATGNKVFPFGPALAAALFLTLAVLPVIR
ncbi:Type 4 prepilin-like proteins leader peptide-processing enzyme [Rhodospirillaceae bacterium LM-1]|nr:Type 4 prepilin-like proteins leader peptide-processing enzyme [Rhodospirillaceae bacterium LM-1]